MSEAVKKKWLTYANHVPAETVCLPPLAGLVRAKYDDPTDKMALWIKFMGMWPPYNGVTLCSFLFHKAGILQTLFQGKKEMYVCKWLTKAYLEIWNLQLTLFKCNTDWRVITRCEARKLVFILNTTQHATRTLRFVVKPRKMITIQHNVYDSYWEGGDGVFQWYLVSGPASLIYRTVHFWPHNNKFPAYRTQ